MGDDLKKELETISTTLHDLGTKFDDLDVKVDRLVPLAPVATKIAALPEKVVTLQSTTFENTEQVRALNLASSAWSRPSATARRPPRRTPTPRTTPSTTSGTMFPSYRRVLNPHSGLPHARNPRSDRRRGTASVRRRMTTSTPTSTHAFASSSPRSTARRTRFRG